MGESEIKLGANRSTHLGSHEGRHRKLTSYQYSRGENTLRGDYSVVYSNRRRHVCAFSETAAILTYRRQLRPRFLDTINTPVQTSRVSHRPTLLQEHFSAVSHVRGLASVSSYNRARSV